MRVGTSTFYVYLCVTSVESFVPHSCSQQIAQNTALHLLPSQGCQLAVASAAASVKEEDRIAHQHDGKLDEKISPELVTPTQAAREFVSRVFSIPSHILPNVSHMQQSWLHNPFEHNEICEDERRDDVVLYPLVGFTFVNVNDEMKVLPPPFTSGACSIGSMRQTKESPVYGWFSPCCQLGDLYGDDETYCGAINNPEAEIYEPLI